MENKIKKGGAFQIARQIFESELWLRKPATWTKLWLYILGRVNHTKNEHFDRGEGFFDFSREKESIDVALTKDGTKKALVYMRKSGMISTSRSTRGVRLKVLNYAKYQTFNNYISTSLDSREAPEKHQRSTPISKNDKNVKNDNYTAEKFSADKYPTPSEGKEKMNCKEFVEWFKKSEERYKNIIADWADTCEPKFRTKAQWEVWAKSQYSIAKELAPFDDEDFIEAYDQIRKSEKIKSFNLRTLKYFVINIKK
jgi:hypothetical protein